MSGGTLFPGGQPFLRQCPPKRQHTYSHSVHLCLAFIYLPLSSNPSFESDHLHVILLPIYYVVMYIKICEDINIVYSNNLGREGTVRTGEGKGRESESKIILEMAMH